MIQRMTKSAKFKVRDILDSIKENKIKHINEYNLAYTVYAEEVKNLLQTQLKNIKEGKEFNIHFDLVKPINKEQEYERQYKIWSMVLEEDIELDFVEADLIFNDNWGFTQQAKLANSTYFR